MLGDLGYLSLKHSWRRLEWADENTVHWGLQDFSFSYLLNIEHLKQSK